MLLRQMMKALRTFCVAAAFAGLAGMASLPRDAGLQAKDIVVDGKALHFVVQPGSEAGPIIVLEAGATLDSTSWNGVIEALRNKTCATVIAYDRAGMGKSAPLDTPYDIVQEVDRLREGLRQLGQARPLLLVGHSYGGYLIQLYAHRNPADVAGIVYVDANTIDGLGGIEGSKALIDAVVKADHEGRGTFNDMRLAKGYVAANTVMSRIPPPQHIPVAVITQGAPDLQIADPGLLRWRNGHLELAKVTGGQLIYAPDTGHMIPTERPELVADVIVQTLNTIRERRRR